MKCSIPEISWHNRDPILSIDIQQKSLDNIVRLASAGADYHILIWKIEIIEIGKNNLEPISDLTRHQRPVNIVRWSPSGHYLASGDDDANIIIWNLKTDNIPSLDGETSDKESWTIFKVLRGHKEDVYDLCWCPNNHKIISGSIDNTAIIWNIKQGKSEHIFGESKGFVQGVTWDPKNQYVGIISSDRVLRIMDCNVKQVKSKVSKGPLPVSESHELFNKEVKYFHDDTFKSFFRRLTFSPDGNLLVVPSGCIQTEDCRKYLNATLIFTLDCLSKPAVLLPLQKQNSVAVRFCPVYFELKHSSSKPYIDLPYRMIFAVATDNDVLLYDTEQTVPFAVLQKIHYTRLTDLTWSPDGCLLMASSTDGFCTIVSFLKEELGIPYTLEENKSNENLEVVETVEEKPEEVERQPAVNILQPKKKPTTPGVLETWAKLCQSSEKSPTENYSDNILKEKSQEGDLNKLQLPETSISMKEDPSVDSVEKKEIHPAEEQQNIQEDKFCSKVTDCIIINDSMKTKTTANVLKDISVKENTQKINVIQVKRKKSMEENVNVIQTIENFTETRKDNGAKEEINVLQVKKKKIVDFKGVIDLKEMKNEDKFTENINTLPVKTKLQNETENKQKKEINVLQVRKKKRDQTVTIPSQRIKLDEPPPVEKDFKTYENNEKKTAEETSNFQENSKIIIEHKIMEFSENASSCSQKTPGKSPKINILQVKRKPGTNTSFKRSLDYSNCEKTKEQDEENQKELIKNNAVTEETRKNDKRTSETSITEIKKQLDKSEFTDYDKNDEDLNKIEDQKIIESDAEIKNENFSKIVNIDKSSIKSKSPTNRKEENKKETPKKLNTPRKPTILEQWTIKLPKQETKLSSPVSKENGKDDDVIIIEDKEEHKSPAKKEKINILIPRRRKKDEKK